MLRPYRNVIAGFARSRRLKRETRRSRKVILSDARRVIARQARDHGWSRRDKLARQRDLRRHLEAYLAALTKAAQFAFYERLFSFWRFLHLPLCYFLVLAAVGHVVAAHLYLSTDSWVGRMCRRPGSGIFRHGDRCRSVGSFDRPSIARPVGTCHPVLGPWCRWPGSPRGPAKAYSFLGPPHTARAIKTTG